MTQGFVYFIRAVDRGGLIKIGFSVDPDARLDLFQKGSPVDLELAVVIPGDLALERAFQGQFEAAHVRNEWFTPTPDLLALIDRLQAGEGVPRPPARSRPIVERRPRSERSRQAQSVNRQLDWLGKQGHPVPQHFKDLAWQFQHEDADLTPIVAALAVHGRRIKGLGA